MRKRTKIFTYLLVVFLLINTGDVLANAEGIDEKSTVRMEIGLHSSQDAEAVKTFSLDFLESYWLSQRGYSYDEMAERFLNPENRVFNEEMKVRAEYDYYKYTDATNRNEELLSEDLKQFGELQVSKEGEVFVVRGKSMEKLYSFLWNGRKLSVSSDPTDVILKIRNIDNKLYLVDFVDYTSFYFNKDIGINEEQFRSEEPEQRKTDVPYGVNYLTQEVTIDSNARGLSPEELETRQLANIQSVREALAKRAQIWSDTAPAEPKSEAEDLTTPRGIGQILYRIAISTDIFISQR